MIQNNITTVTPKVDPSVEQALKEIAKQDLGDERGWLGILTRLTIPLPQTTAIYPITLLH